MTISQDTENADSSQVSTGSDMDCGLSSICVYPVENLDTSEEYILPTTSAGRLRPLTIRAMFDCAHARALTSCQHMAELRQSRGKPRGASTSGLRRGNDAPSGVRRQHGSRLRRRNGARNVPASGGIGPKRPSRRFGCVYAVSAYHGARRQHREEPGFLLQQARHAGGPPRRERGRPLHAGVPGRTARTSRKRRPRTPRSWS